MPARSAPAMPSLALAFGLLTAGAGSSAATLTTLHRFSALTVAGQFQGAYPVYGVARAPDGTLYGSTYSGLARDGGPSGILYTLDASGHYSVLRSLARNTTASALALSAGGALYGTSSSNYSSGSVFTLRPAGAFRNVNPFGAAQLIAPTKARLVLDPDGTAFGLTVYGGYTSPDGNTGGAVFKIDTLGIVTTLHDFQGGTDGYTPLGGLVRDSLGNLYGTTFYGGDFDLGTVFRLSPSGQETILHSFAGGTDGNWCYSGMVIDTQGNLLGTTAIGGTSGNGTVFKITPSGTESILYSFGGGSDGSQPHDAPTLDSAGNLYGVTYYGGPANLGVVYKITPSGQETVLHAFSGPGDGYYPSGTLSIDASDTLYGTTGGDFYATPSDYGTVFKITQ